MARYKTHEWTDESYDAFDWLCDNDPIELTQLARSLAVKLDSALQWIARDGLEDLTENELAMAYAYSDQADVESGALAESERRSFIRDARSLLVDVWPAETSIGISGLPGGG